MSDLILDQTILDAVTPHFWPAQEKGCDAIPACFDLSIEAGHLKLTHEPMQDWFLVTSQLVRIAVPPIANINHFQKALATGGALRNAFIELRCATVIDRGILAACSAVKNELMVLSEHPSNLNAVHGNAEFISPILKPYDRWSYGIEQNKNEVLIGNQEVLAFPSQHVSEASKRFPNLIVKDLDKLIADGLSPSKAKIGVLKYSPDYEMARLEWIEIAIDSLVANIEDSVARWPVMPGQPFQNVVRLDDDLFFIKLNAVEGLTVASTTKSQQILEQFLLEVHRVGRSQLARVLATLRRAIV